MLHANARQHQMPIIFCVAIISLLFLLIVLTAAIGTWRLRSVSLPYHKQPIVAGGIWYWPCLLAWFFLLAAMLEVIDYSNTPDLLWKCLLFFGPFPLSCGLSVLLFRLPPKTSPNTAPNCKVVSGSPDSDGTEAQY